MRRSKIHFVTRGRVVGSGITKTAAKADAERRIDLLCNAPDPHIETRFGHVLIVHQLPSGDSTYVILDPADIASHGKVHHSCTYSGSSVADLIEFARYHLAQLVWTIEADDDAHIAAAGVGAAKAVELRRYFRWQRDYARHKAEGKSDVDAYRLATAG